MKSVKISLFLKVLVFIINLLLLINVIIIPQNIFWISNIIPFLVLFINSILFYFVLKNNKLAIKLFWAFLLLILGWINYIFNFLNNDILNSSLSLNNTSYFIIIPYILFLILILLNLYFLNKNINKWVENLNEKLITEKKQYNSFAIVFIISFIFLLIFRFWYYAIEKDIEDIDELFFITKYQNIDIKNEDNLYNDLKSFKYKEHKTRYIKEKILECLYEDKCYWTLDDYKFNINRINDNEIWQFEFKGKKDEILNKREKLIIKWYLKQNINLLYVFENSELTDNVIKNMISNFSKKKYYKSNIDETLVFTDFIQFNRELKYQVLYYINNNNEAKAIEILQAQINTLYTMLEWDSNIIDTLVAITWLKIWFENIDLLIKNYKLSDNSKNLLLSLLNRDINKNSLDNSLKNDHKWLLKEGLWNINKWLVLEWINTTLFSYEETKKWFNEIVHDKINNNWIVSDIILDKYSKLNFIKSNIIWQVLWFYSDVSYTSQYKKLSDLNNFRKDLILKLWNN